MRRESWTRCTHLEQVATVELPPDGPGDFVIDKRPQRLAIYAPHRIGR